MCGGLAFRGFAHRVGGTVTVEGPVGGTDVRAAGALDDPQSALGSFGQVVRVVDLGIAAGGCVVPRAHVGGDHPPVQADGLHVLGPAPSPSVDDRHALDLGVDLQAGAQ